MRRRREGADVEHQDKVSGLHLEGLLEDFDPPAEKHRVPCDELLVAQSDDERVEEGAPGVVLLPLGLEDAVADVLHGRAGVELAFCVEGLVEDHGEDGRDRGHEAGEDEGENYLGRFRSSLDHTWR